MNDAREFGKGSPDKLVFGRGSSGKYLTVSAPKAASYESLLGTFITAEGAECSFVNVAENSGYVNYTLYPEVMIGYKIKSSVTL